MNTPAHTQSRWFRWFVVGLFALTGLSKIVTALVDPVPMTVVEPLTGLPHTLVVLPFALWELWVALRFGRGVISGAEYWFLGGFCVVLLLYRGVLKVNVVRGGCPCLGALLQWLPVGDAGVILVDQFLVLSLGIMLVGAIYYGWRSRLSATQT